MSCRVDHAALRSSQRLDRLGLGEDAGDPSDGVGQVVDEVLWVFEADGEAYEIGRESLGGADGLGDRRVRHAPGKAGGGVHAAEADGDVEELERLDDPARDLGRAGLKAEHRARAAGLAFVDDALVALGEAREVNGGDGRMTREGAGDSGGSSGDAGDGDR